MKDLNIPISPIGYGCYALSGAYGENLSEREKISIVQAAYHLGVRFFDTAGAYTGTEEILGKALQPHREMVSIATKVSLDENKQTNLSKKAVLSSCEKSLKSLHTDYIDLFQVHFDDPYADIEETIEALELLKTSGKIKHYGIGHLPLNRSLDYLRLGKCSTVLAEMNPLTLNRYHELSPYLDQFQFQIIAFSVTARGLLTGKIQEDTIFSKSDLRRIDPQFKRAKLHSGLRIFEKLSKIGEKYEKTSSQIAIAWVLQNKGVLAALTGPTKMYHLEENLAVMDWKIPEEDLEDLNRFLKGENQLLQKKVQEEIKKILKNPFNENPEIKIEDLVYVLENLIEGNFLPSEKGFPIFIELLNLSDEEKIAERFELFRERIISEAKIDV